MRGDYTWTGANKAVWLMMNCTFFLSDRIKPTTIHFARTTHNQYTFLTLGESCSMGCGAGSKGRALPRQNFRLNHDRIPSLYDEKCIEHGYFDWKRLCDTNFDGLVRSGLNLSKIRGNEPPFRLKHEPQGP
ncbi:hypothetical protein PROFUN_14055 [Planoprotostelium fungivorum]|uniref:Uncharacterized protein n=1 Tax=Planoprotostelium fungivorum TaxID=1890364 RepID=A0A2P6N235_9EUKA|nr:hypothetical protein PROFUN_14055 [Planoprotostelium fungivorum]